MVFLGGFVGFFLISLFLLVCFQILDLLCFPEEPLQGSDGLRVLFSWRVMKRLVLIMIRLSINAEVPADNIPKADVLGFYPVFVKQELAVFIYLKRFIGEDIRIQVMLQQGGCISVINDPKYVAINNETAKLTEYALAHVDECCLVFDRKTRVSTNYDDSFYRICFLCRDADSKSFVEASFN